MPKIKIEKDLYEKIKKISLLSGYSSVNEFVTHVLEKEVVKLEEVEDDPDIMERLKGLGYI